MTTGKTIALTRQTFVGKVMSLLFNTLSGLVITFLPRSKHLLISWLQWFWSTQNEVCHCFHCLPIYLPWSDGTRCHDLRFLNVELEANFFTRLFHVHQEAFSSSLLSTIRVVSSAYLRLLIFLPIGTSRYVSRCSFSCHWAIFLTFNKKLKYSETRLLKYLYSCHWL